MANVYEKNLKNLYNQIGVMLQEANSVNVNADGMDENDPLSQKLWRKVTDLARVLKDSMFDPNVLIDKTALKQILSEITRGTAGLAFDKFRDLTLDAKDYQSFKTGYKALQIISQNSKLWTDAEQKELGRDPSIIKKSYITIGVGLMIASIVLSIMSGKAMDIVTDFQNINSIIREPKKLGVFLTKLLGIGVLAVPGILGMVVVICASRDFNDEGYLAKVMAVCYPIMKIAHPLINKIIMAGKTTINGYISNIKRDFRLK